MIIKKKHLEQNILLIEAINNWSIPFYIPDEHDSYEEILLKINREELSEGLIKSYNQDFVGKRLSEYGAILKIDGTLYLGLKDFTDIDFIKDYSDTFGYFIAQYKILFNGKAKNQLNYVDYNTPDEFKDKMGDINELWLVVEPKFDKPTDTDNIKFLYHLTDKIYLDKINSNGLVPKSKSKKSYHPDRVYVVIELGKLKGLLKHFIKDGKNINELIILKINYKLANTPKLYNDPNYLNYGFYTTENIPPNAIVLQIDPNEVLNHG